jgi:hypothetical protein
MDGLIPWPLPARWREQPQAPKERNPYDVSTWGPDCARGWVRDSRFGPGQMIPGTNRASQRKKQRV